MTKLRLIWNVILGRPVVYKANIYGHVHIENPYTAVVGTQIHRTGSKAIRV